MENSNNTKPNFKATLISGPSSIQKKVNGAEYVVYTAEITQDGPMKGVRTGAAFTTKNRDGVVKQAPNKGDEITVYVDIVDGVARFTIGSGMIETTSNEDILARLALAVPGQTV